METFRFDEQSSGFDKRAGIPGRASAKIAGEIRGLCHVDKRDLVVEIGAGTGEIGCDLARERCNYVGLDVAYPMLEVFHRKLAFSSHSALLVQADASTVWPVTSGKARLIFLSRAAHLFEPSHLRREVYRIKHPGDAWLVLGQVRRSPESLRARMRTAMRALLREAGIEGRSGERAKEALVEELVRFGGENLGVREVASWEVPESPAASLSAWRAKSGLAGRSITPHLKHEVLDRLEAWARTEFNDLRLVQSSIERYEITPVRLMRS